jgi:hypothetical protein
MTRRTRQAVNWAFAMTFFFAVWFLIALVAGMVTGGDFRLTIAGYSYTGPIYGCLPAMFIGLFSVGGSVLYLVVSFLEGRAISRYNSQSRGITEELKARDPILTDDHGGREGNT